MGDVVVGLPGGRPVQGGLDAEADDPDLAVLVDQYVLGPQPVVGGARGVRAGDRVGYLGDHPGGAQRAERVVGLHHQVERQALAPLVHDVAEAGGEVGVEDAQVAAVAKTGRATGGIEQCGGPLVVGVEQVHRHRTLENGVLGAPEPATVGLAEEVDHLVAPGQEVTGADRGGHVPPAPSSVH